MGQRQLGCGKKPSYGPIPRDDGIWTEIWNPGPEPMIKAFAGWPGDQVAWDDRCHIPTDKKSETKSCGDFDDNSSTGVYICEGCITNIHRIYAFLQNYDK